MKLLATVKTEKFTYFRYFSVEFADSTPTLLVSGISVAYEELGPTTTVSGIRVELYALGWVAESWEIIVGMFT